jgi:uncharacterized protein (DUF488 family)
VVALAFSSEARTKLRQSPTAMPDRHRDNAKPFFTIGHSTRPILEFVSVLNSTEIKLVVDVRAVPRSRTNPQYDLETLQGSLNEVNVGYEHIAALGGWRSRPPNVAETVNALWQNQSFHNYADYAMTEPFQEGLGRLRSLGYQQRCVIMCAEAVWWRCHRRIITDYLIAAGEAVFHIFGLDHVEPARITPGAARGPDGTLVYPATE